MHRVDYREADDLVAVTQQLLNHPTPRDVEIESASEPTVVELLGPDTTEGGESVRRSDFVDFHVSDGIGCVMLGETVVALSFLATRILTLLGERSATSTGSARRSSSSSASPSPATPGRSSRPTSTISSRSASSPASDAIRSHHCVR